MLLMKCGPIFLVSLLMAGTAWADDVGRREDEARTACLAGDYSKGVAILSQLFVKTRLADFIYNQGRCFEQNHRYEDAIARFEEFLRVSKKLSKRDRAETKEHIEGCRKSLGREAPVVERVAEPSGKEGKDRAARKACLTGDPATGVALLSDMYLDTKDPTHLFNQGRCFEQNRRYEDAIARFREYLEKAKDLSAEDRLDTDRHIAKCESFLREKPQEGAKTESRTPPTDKLPVGEASPALPPQTTPTVSLDTAAAAPADRPGSGLRLAGGIVAGVGVAGLATGLFLNLRVNSMSSDLEKDWSSGTNSSRQDYKTGAWIAYGAGAACVVGGAVLYYLGWRTGEHALAIGPAVGPNMAGTFLSGAF
jgi:Flp pilus assembly protein TadD